jgi:hypothetical protein
MRPDMGKVASGLLVFVGVLWMVGIGWVAANTAVAYGRTGDAPDVVAVADAPEIRWIRLEGAKVRCDTRTVHDQFTYFFAEDGRGGNPFVVQLTGDVPCEGAVLEGGFVPGRFTRAFLAERYGVKFPGEGEVRLFTQALAKPFLRKLLLQTLALLLPGALALFIGVRAARRARTEAPPRRS